MSVADVFSQIESHSGLIINSAHRLFMENVVRQRMAALSMTADEYGAYLRTSAEELKVLTDEAAINETYFFREEQQFDFLEKYFFPARAGKRPAIWSAACSTGEEPLSLYALARHCGQDAEVYASDIDTTALARLKAGSYTQSSLRVDGMRFAPLLARIGKKGPEGFTADREVIHSIKSFYYNLASEEPPPFAQESLDLIFIRNVFIYFSPKMRQDILHRLGRVLSPDGLLFLSVNEIASVECARGSLLEKDCTGSVYYLRKRAVPPPEAETERAGLRPPPPPPPASAAEPAEPLDPQPRTVPAAASLAPKEREGVEELYARFAACLDAHDAAGAEAVLKGASFLPQDMEYKYYFQGQLLAERQQAAEAADCFTKATLLNKDFWPAWFQLAMLRRQERNEAAGGQAFATCAGIVESYIQKRKTCYNFLISHFSPEYVLLLCRNYTGGQGKHHAV